MPFFLGVLGELCEKFPLHIAIVLAKRGKLFQLIHSLFIAMSTTDTALLKHVPLSDAHVRAGGRMVEFGGWWMPVQYSSILDEHATVRNAAGLFDISHMGEFVVKGPQAGAWLNSLLTNDIDKLGDSQGQYSIMLNEQGGVIDDLILYRIAADEYYVIVNASMIDEDYKWAASKLPASGVTLTNLSDKTAGLALQGPKAEEILKAFLFGAIGSIPKRNTIAPFVWNDIEGRVARTGYTGEDGFEFFFPAADAEKIWDGILAAGKPLGLKPAGLGCRDTLRLEACLPLNGNDLSPKRTPLEAGLGFFVSLTKAADFPGKSVLQKQKSEGAKQKLAAFKLTSKGAPPRSHYPLLGGGVKIGEISSGSLSPTLGYGIGMGYIDAAWAEPGKEIEIEVRGSRVPAIVVKKPFYKRNA